MPKKPIRFVVGAEGEQRELLSVKENTDGGLMVKIPAPPPVPDSASHLLALKYSIHASLQARDGGFLIHETAFFSNGNRSDEYAHVKPNDGAAMLHFCAIAPPSAILLPDIRGRQAKQVIPIFYEIPKAAMFYVLVAARSELKFRDLPPGLTVVEARFKRYTLFVCAGLFNTPGMDTAIVVTTSSKPVKLNGVEHLEPPYPLEHEPVSPRPHQMAYVVEELIDRLAEGMKDTVDQVRHQSGRELSDEEKAKLNAGYDVYFSDPAPSRATNRLLARAGRIAHPPSGLWLPPNGPEQAPCLPGLPSKAPGQ